MVLGLICIGISVFIGYLNNFQGSDGYLLLMAGASMTAVGFVFTPKIWEITLNVVDLVVMAVGEII